MTPAMAPQLASLAAAFGVAWSPAAVQAPQGAPAPGAAQKPPVEFVDAKGAVRPFADMIADLASAKVVAVGEQHDDAVHHALEAATLSAVAAARPNTVLALEMVAAEDQPTLDRFASGAMSEADFAAFWNKTWGYDYALYKPVFDAARAKGLKMYGVNAPSALADRVRQVGLAGLTPAERARLPFSVKETDDPRYKALLEMMLGHGGKVSPLDLPKYREAQAVWNETMGDNVARLAAGGSTVVLVVGEAHVFFDAGVVESAKRRGLSSARVLLPVETGGGAVPPDFLGLGDWFAALP